MKNRGMHCVEEHGRYRLAITSYTLAVIPFSSSLVHDPGLDLCSSKGNSIIYLLPTESKRYQLSGNYGSPAGQPLGARGLDFFKTRPVGI